MNKLFGIIFCVLPFLLNSQSQFKVELNLVGLKNNKVRVSHIVNGKSKVDTLTPKKDDYILLYDDQYVKIGEGNRLLKYKVIKENTVYRKK